MLNEQIIIKRIYKRGKYYYLSCTDGEEYKLEVETYFKYSLKEKMAFEGAKFLEIIDENNFKLCMNSALRLLSQRMHSEGEIKRKLKSKDFSYKAINQVIEESKKMNLLNDEIFAKTYIEELLFKGQGKYKIIASLQKRGIPKEMIDDNLSEMDDPAAEEKRAEEVLDKKLKSFAGKDLDPRKLKEKLVRHLISKGFPADIVFKVVGEKVE